MKIFICDDDVFIRNDIEKFVRKYFLRHSCYSFEIIHKESGEDLLATSEDVDILFLDISMGGINGIEVAKEIMKRHNSTVLIFVTSYLCYAPDTFRVGAFRMLNKPIKEDDFNNDFEKALEKYKSYHEKFVFYSGSNKIAADYNDVVYLESYNRHITVNTINNKYDIVGKMSTFEENLVMNGFVRIHQGYIVNMKYIRIIGTSEVELVNDDCLPLSKRKRDNILNTYAQFLS